MSGTICEALYLIAALALAAAAPMLSEGESQSEVISNNTENSSGITPTLKCLTDGDSIENLSTLFYGHLTVIKYLEEPCSSDVGYQSFSISRKALGFGTRTTSTSLHTLASIIQAYSVVVLLLSDSAYIPEEDRKTMKVTHELLNGLLQNYYNVISPNHCNCTADERNSCVTIEDLSEQLNLRSFPENCSNAVAYISQSIYNEIRWMSNLLVNQHESSKFRLLTSSTCPRWINEYIPANSQAYPAAITACNELVNS